MAILQNLINKIRGRDKQDAEMLRLLAVDLVYRLRDYTPVQSGAMQTALSYISQPKKSAGGWTIGVGNAELLGNKDLSAPKGTIKSFLKDFPKYKSYRKLSQPSMAWWYLSPEGKQVLDDQRMMGKYGGVGATYARYVWTQNEGNPNVGITAKHFIEKALDEWRQNAPSIVQAVINA